MTDKSVRRESRLSWRRDWPLYAAWPLIGLLTLLLSATALMLAGQPVPWVLLAWSMMAWAQWILIVPVIIWVARGWPLDRAGYGRLALAHFSCFAFAWIGHSALVYLWRYLLFGRWVSVSFTTLREDLSIRLPTWLVYDALIYLTTVAGAHALELHRRLRERAVRQAQLEARVAEAELELMRMEVQPAFILRTLASARRRLEDSPRRTEIMISKLAEVLRGSLESLGSDRVALDDELRHVRSWIAVEALRADRLIEMEIDCDQQSLRQEIPKYLIGEVIAGVVDATPASERVAVHLVAAEVGGLLAVRLSVEASGCGAVGSEAVAQLQHRLGAAAGETWSVTVDELDSARIAVSIDRSPEPDPDANGPRDLQRPLGELAIDY